MLKLLILLTAPIFSPPVQTTEASQCLSTHSQCACHLIDTHSLIASLLDYNLTPSNTAILRHTLASQPHSNEHDSRRPAHLSLTLTCRNQSLTAVPSFKRLGYSRQATTNYLDLTANSIHEIPAGIFYGLLVSSIDLSNNQLRSTNFNSLNGIVNILTVLKLNNNQLTHQTLFANLFISKLTRLRALLVANNSLQFIAETSLPASVRATIQILDLKSNSISFLSDQAFTNCPLLTYLNLDANLLASNNSSSSLQLGFLQQVPSLQTLLLAANNLHTIRGGFKNFARSSQLKLLNLDKNSLRSLTGLFCQQSQKQQGLSSLQVLHLSSNIIEQISSLDFSCLYSLHQLHLSNNNIKFVNSGSFESLASLRELRVDKNPLVPYPNMFSGVQGSLRHLSISVGTHFDKRLDKAVEVLVLDSGMAHLETLDMSDSSFETLAIDVVQLVVTTRNLKRFVCHRCEVKQVFLWVGREEDEAELVGRTCAVGKLRKIEIDLKDNKISECASVCFSERECKSVSGESGLARRIVRYVLVGGLLEVGNFQCTTVGVRGHQGVKSWQEYFEGSVVGRGEVELCAGPERNWRGRYGDDLIETYVNFFRRFSATSGAVIDWRLGIEGLRICFLFFVLIFLFVNNA